MKRKRKENNFFLEKKEKKDKKEKKNPYSANDNKNLITIKFSLND